MIMIIYNITTLLFNIFLDILLISLTVIILLLLLEYILVRVLPLLGTFINTYLTTVDEIDKYN